MAKAAGAALLATTVLLLAAIAAATALLGPLAAGGTGSTAAVPSQRARTDIPPGMLVLYQRATAECPGLSWTILAAIGKVETDHARHPTMVSHAGAVGPMQFLPETFARYDHPIPPGGATPPTPWHPVNATHAAARLLCDHGGAHPQRLENAIWHYNPDRSYVRTVLTQAARYAARPAGSYPATPPPNSRAADAVTYARAQLGLPYLWGGNGPAAGHAGFDCSGLTQAAYAHAGIPLPRVAHDQYTAGPHLPPHAPLQPGDLLFYGTPEHVHHVGIYVGDGRMINAPRPGTLVREEPYRYPGDDYLGATRPTA